MPEEDHSCFEINAEIDAIILMIDYLRRQVAELDPIADALSAALAKAETCAVAYRLAHPTPEVDAAPSRSN